MPELLFSSGLTENIKVEDDIGLMSGKGHGEMAVIALF